MKSAISKSPILIIDTEGLIGVPLSLKLSSEFPVVFVSRKDLDFNPKNKNINHVSFLGKFPVIPDHKYSHVIFVDEGSEIEYLSKIIEKVKNVNAEFLFALSLLSKVRSVSDKILQLYPSSKIVIFGDIFDNQIILKKDGFKSIINKYIYQAQRFGKMQILGEGMRESYPVFLGDVVDGLIDLVFGIQKSQSLFYLFPKHPVSELSLAHMIQKMNPEITIDFIRHDSRLGNITFPANGKYLLNDKYQLAKKIRNIDIKKRLKGNEKMKLKNDGKSKSFKGIQLFIAWILIFLIFSPLIFTSLLSSLGLKTLYYAKAELDKGNFANAKSSLRLSETSFYLGKQTANILLFQAKIVGLENSSNKFLYDINSGYKVAQSLLGLFNSETYFSKIISGKSTDPFSDFVNGENDLRNSIISLNKIKAEGKIPAPILQKLEILNPLIKLLSAIADIMPNIFGMDGQKTYLIILQNNLELRPGGGAIDSYGVLKLNQGKVAEFSLHDVLDADSRLRGHVEPPFAIRRHLPSEHWYMRDSNFDVDFVKTALSASNFFLVETGEKADGVIAVDGLFLKNLLHVVGPVYVPEYKKTIDENNFLHSTLTFKKDFLRILSQAIMSKIAEGKTSYLMISKVISDGLAQKHLLFEFKDAQNIFTVNGWSSSLWDERENSKNRINDFIGINEANLGMNKSNYFIQRELEQTVKIEQDGSLLGELKLNYLNSGTLGIKENYKNYLRIILPFDALISSISIDDVPQTIIDAIVDPQIYSAKNFKMPKGLEVEKTIDGQKIIYGFLVNVPAGELIKIEIQYNIPRKDIFDPNNFDYGMRIFKQPGIDDLPYSFFLYYPDSLKTVNTKDLKMEDNSLSYKGNIAEDKDLIVSFSKR